MKRISFALGMGMGWVLGLSCAEPSVVAPGAKVEKLAGDFEFTSEHLGDLLVRVIRFPVVVGFLPLRQLSRFARDLLVRACAGFC